LTGKTSPENGDVFFLEKNHKYLPEFFDFSYNFGTMVSRGLFLAYIKM